MSSKEELEEGKIFDPQFDSSGLIPCITTSAQDGVVLMFAWMNKEALEKTLSTGEMHYWSRSRKALWHKGATSGLTQKLAELCVDCDQDCLWASVTVATPDATQGREASCHTGRRSCFYRVISAPDGLKLQFKDDDKVFDKKDVY